MHGHPSEAAGGQSGIDDGMGSDIALSDAVLVCLTERLMAGYELAQAFDASASFSWRADHQQIYREPARPRAKGDVRADGVIQSGKAGWRSGHGRRDRARLERVVRGGARGAPDRGHGRRRHRRLPGVEVR